MIDTQAHAAYEAFRKHRRHWRPLPEWNLLLDRDREVWIEVAKAVTGETVREPLRAVG